MLRILAIVTLLTACKSDESGKPAPRASSQSGAGKAGASDTVHGAITVDGRDLPVTGCEAKDGLDGVEVRLSTSEGVLVVAEELRWGQADAPRRGVEMDCAADRKDYFAGKDEHGAYWKGALDFDCKVTNHTVKGSLIVSCGKISPELEAKWTEHKQRMKAEMADLAEQLAADGGVAADAGAP